MSIGSGPAIEVTGLVKTYKKIEALRGLDFEIPAGTVAGFLGPNGSGKTTTFRSLLGLTRFDAGDVRVLGHSVPSQLLEVSKSVGAIIEEPGLIRALNGRNNLKVAADQLGFGHEKIEELLEFVSLTKDAGRRVSEYSKGMRQRLALAAALLGDPELLLLDEPLDGLDPAGQRAFRDRLRAVAEAGQTVVVSSHDMADIEALADYVVLINKGRLVTQGPIEGLLDGGATRVTVENPESAIVALRNAGLGVSISHLELVVESGDGSHIVEVLAQAGIYPSEVRADRASLENFFLRLTGGEISPGDVR